MTGREPASLFMGLSDDAVAAGLKKWKEELGSVRQTGKVGNLSLLYAMSARGLQEAASKNYDIHWSLEEATAIRNQWLMSYPEIELWHLWTDYKRLESVRIPDMKAGGQLRNTGVYISRPLSEREIYAFGLNAALSYEDQSSGADMMALVMRRLEGQHPLVFDCVINQVHDELVAEIPEQYVDTYVPIIHKTMVNCAEQFTMQYGVHCECSPAVGDQWLKD